MPPEDQSDWEHVARLLRDRRTELEPRYKNKQLFSEERGIHRRMLWLVESGRPANYQTDTRQVIEKAYGLVPGSFGRLLVGGDLERAGAGPDPAPRLSAVPDRPREPAPDADEAAWTWFIARLPDCREKTSLKGLMSLPETWETRRDLIIRWQRRTDEMAARAERLASPGEPDDAANDS